MKTLSEENLQELKLLSEGIESLQEQIKDLREDDINTFTNARKIAGLQDQIFNLLHLSHSILQESLEYRC